MSAELDPYALTPWLRALEAQEISCGKAREVIAAWARGEPVPEPPAVSEVCARCQDEALDVPGRVYLHMGQEIPRADWMRLRAEQLATEVEQRQRIAAVDAALGLDLHRCRTCGAPRSET